MGHYDIFNYRDTDRILGVEFRVRLCLGLNHSCSHLSICYSYIDLPYHYFFIQFADEFRRGCYIARKLAYFSG